ncbi:hypothetical protein EXIGLDRAFT_562611, partial [Exidia glandulosa HHB12029]
LNSTGSGTTAVAGVFDIAFRFCRANGTSTSLSALQLLGHGATYTKDYWAFPIQPEMYSYELHANRAGYSTLSYDLLGAGDSGKPDPFSVVQLPLHVSIAAKIAAMARAGTLSPALLPFAHIIYVAHSMGSVVLNGVMSHCTPAVVDGALLTGYTHPIPNIPPPSSDGVLQEADTAFPDRFAGLSPGYRVAPDRTAFYGPEGTFDAHVLAVDAATQDLVTIGDVVSFSLPEVAAPTFGGHVLVIVGEFGGANCMGNCSNVNSILAPRHSNRVSTSYSFPWIGADASVSDIISQTGHNLNLHLSAPVTYALMLDWVKR